MATIINNPSGTSEGGGIGSGLVIGIIVAVVLLLFLLLYGIPALRQTDVTPGNGSPSIQTPDRIDVNINPQ